MKQYNDKAVAAILEAGKNEILEKGYEKASMRSIAASAGVTTGSIYGYFKNKSDLFNSLVSEPADKLLEQYRAETEKCAGMTVEEQIGVMNCKNENYFDEMLDFIFDHVDAFRLIARHAKGTDYEDYIDRLIEVEEKSTLVFIDAMKRKHKEMAEVSQLTIHIIAGTLFHGVFEVITHELSREEAKKQINIYQRFYTAGWFELFGIKDRNNR